MALLKAFVCQVILLGFYKLFFEQVVEEHLVPDELTRNCLVGFVCLLCFGIQLYTDKADEDNAEADESPKAKSKSRREKNAKSLNGKPVEDSKERSSAISPIEAEKVTDVGHSGIFGQFSPYMRNAVPNVKADGIEEPEVPASTAHASYDQNIPVVSGFSETKFYEESDEDGIEIDKFIASELARDEDELLRIVKAEEVNKSDVTETVVESECLTINGEDYSSALRKNMTTTSFGQSEAEVTNSAADESLNNIDVSNIIDEVESKKSVKDDGKIGNRQEIGLSSEPDEHTRNTGDSPLSAQEMNSTSSPTAKTINDVEAINTNEELPTLVKAAVSSPLEKLTISTRQNATAGGDLCFTPVTIDISFIYACH